MTMMDTPAIQKMGENDAAWIAMAYDGIKRLAKRKEQVHVNDVWDLAEREGWAEPLNRKSLGHAFRRAAADGVLVSSDYAIRVSHNGGHYWRPVWFSQVYKKGTK